MFLVSPLVRDIESGPDLTNAKTYNPPTTEILALNGSDDDIRRDRFRFYSEGAPRGTQKPSVIVGTCRTEFSVCY